MMKYKQNKMIYNAPVIEVAEFATEWGYAASGMPTQAIGATFHVDGGNL